MSPSERCDEILRMIDDVLAGNAPPATDGTRGGGPRPGTSGRSSDDSSGLTWWMSRSMRPRPGAGGPS